MLEEINLKREKMMKSAEITGFTSKETIFYSQELDRLIYQYQCTLRSQPKTNRNMKNGICQMLIWPRASLTSEFIFI
jgi:stage 0 sporulation regulatory protein